jgi:hypothetical protein
MFARLAVLIWSTPPLQTTRALAHAEVLLLLVKQRPAVISSPNLAKNATTVTPFASMAASPARAKRQKCLSSRLEMGIRVL